MADSGFPASVEATERLLAAGGYVADRALATTVHLALAMGRPLLLEGEPGTGKTEIAKVLASGLGRVLDPEPRQNLSAERIRRPPVIVQEPVRSGQRIYAAEADLIVLHSVSPGAQLLADGCIHVYGALRGAASAGLGDDPHARIFAKNFDAEMVSIAGLYLGAEDFPPGWAKRPAQVSLDDGALRFAPLP